MFTIVKKNLKTNQQEILEYLPEGITIGQALRICAKFMRKKDKDEEISIREE